MPISPEAIDSFLARRGALLPDFKRMSREALLQSIERSTGYPWHPGNAGIGTSKRDHIQLQGLAFALYVRRALLFYAVRTGKTKLALDWCSHLKRSGLARGKGLVIAHKPIAIELWEQQAQRFSALSIWPLRTEPNTPKRLVDALESDCDLIVTTWSVLQTLFGEKRLSRKKVSKLYPDHRALALAAPFFSHVVIDEIQFCQHWDSLRFAIASELVAECTFRLGMTGTPFGRSAFPIWAETFLVDGGYTFGRVYQFFEAAFGTKKKNRFSGRDEYTFDPAKLPILNAKLSSLMLSCELSEVEDLHILADSVELSMPSEQKQAYNEVVDKLVTLRSGQEIAIEATFHRLRQVASGYLPYEDDGQRRIVHFPHSVKLEWLESLLEELPPKFPVVIFHEYTHSGELICRLLTAAKRKHAWLYGETALKEQTAAWRAFQAGEVDVLVANSVTGGTGIELSRADYVIFFESNPSPIIRSQTEARALARSGRPLVIDDLICAPVEGLIRAFHADGANLLASVMRSTNLAERLRAI